MTSVLSADPPFAFLHIPKCAGATIGTQIMRQVSCDPVLSETRDRVDPVLGRYQGAHLTLRDLERAFPDLLARVRAVPGYAILRDPFARFKSALAEYLRINAGLRTDQLAPSQLEEEIAQIIATCRADQPRLPRAFVHFTPQVEYVFLGGEQVLRHLFVLEQIDRFAAALKAQTGILIDTGLRRRRAQHLPRRYTPVLVMLRQVKHVLPGRLYQRVRAQAMDRLATDRDEVLDRLCASAKVTGFITDFYARDIALHASIKTGGAASAAIPNTN